MNFEVVVEDFTDLHLVPLFQLMASYFAADDRLLSRAYSLWLYAANPFGRACMVHVCDGERWIGFMALIPVGLARADEKLTAYYVVNVLVHPAFHGKNLFGEMIKAAMAKVTNEGTALMGHPNALALKSWQRAEMHFHESLRPSMAVPRPWQRGLSAERVMIPDDLEPLRAQLNDLCRASAFWRVAATPEYLAWRYLHHPTNQYNIQRIVHSSSLVGIQISKRIKRGMGLLLDQFIADEHVKAAAGLLPLGTICFLPDSVTGLRVEGKLSLPLKKRRPIFLTWPRQPVSSTAAARLGLSPSDF